jgi:TRAP-type C4-dicarboxylate transport system permease small subunit
MFVWMAKFGAAYGVRTGIHVGVDVMINRLPPREHKLYVLFGLLAGALFTGIVGTLGATFVWDIAHTASVSPDLELPKWFVYLCIPLGSYLMCFRFLQVAWRSRAPVSCRSTTSRTSKASTGRGSGCRADAASGASARGAIVSTAATRRHAALAARWPALLP